MCKDEGSAPALAKSFPPFAYSAFVLDLNKQRNNGKQKLMRSTAMFTERARLVSGHAYMQRQLKQMHRGEGPGVIFGAGQTAFEAGRLMTDFGRQALLFAGLAMLVGIILAATTGSQLYSQFIAWTGWFQN
jgi:hypothetical protein